MRKWHRWFSFIFGAFLLFISVTGVLSHIAAMYAQGSIFEQEKKEERGAPAASPAASPASRADQAQAAPSAAPNAEQKRNPKRKLVGLLHHLHSGEFFGPVGVVLSLLSGLAMIFFSFSGLWMYYQMFVRRRKLGKAELFWD
jgi:uncharacterized iron-regulated membrane protein